MDKDKQPYKFREFRHPVTKITTLIYDTDKTDAEIIQCLDELDIKERLRDGQRKPHNPS